MVGETKPVNTDPSLSTTDRVSFGARLKQERVRLRYGVENFAVKVGVHKGSQIKYEKGERSPDAEYLSAARLLSVDLMYLITGNGPPMFSDISSSAAHLAEDLRAAYVAYQRTQTGDTPGSAQNDDGVIVVSRLEKVFAANEAKPGAPRLLEALAMGREMAATLGVAPEMLSIVEVQGSAMSPTFEHGDHVIIDRSVSAMVGDDVYALTRAGAVALKRLQRTSDGGMLLLSDNASYQTERLSSEDCAKNLNIVGRVLPYKFGRVKL